MAGHRNFDSHKANDAVDIADWDVADVARLIERNYMEGKAGIVGGAAMAQTHGHHLMVFYDVPRPSYPVEVVESRVIEGSFVPKKRAEQE